MDERGSGASAEGLLGSLEYEAMTSLWEDAPANVPAVLERLNSVRGEREQLAYTTVMTILVRLHEKGLLDRVRRGRSYDYWPLFDEASLVERFSRRDVDELVARYGPVALAHFAAAVEQADPEVVKKLRQAARRSKDA